mgnify:CR=1 FL=1
MKNKKQVTQNIMKTHAADDVSASVSGIEGKA